MALSLKFTIRLTSIPPYAIWNPLKSQGQSRTEFYSNLTRHNNKNQ